MKTAKYFFIMEWPYREGLAYTEMAEEPTCHWTGRFISGTTTATYPYGIRGAGVEVSSE